MPGTLKRISVITPVWNEQESVEECADAIRRLFQTELSGYDHEHIFCDNASTDDTVAVLRKLAKADPHVRAILNSRNFGPSRSTFNGMLAASGDAVVCLFPVDLQDPPELIVQFVRKWEQGCQVVYGIRKRREESFTMASVRRLYYRAVTRFADIHIPPNVGDFQLIDRTVLEALRQCDDYYPYIRGMIASCGFKSAGIEYNWKAREHGLSKNRLYHLIDQALNGLISFTNVPLRLCMFFGFFVAMCSILYAVAAFVINLVFYRQLAAPGIATLIVALFFFSGVQLFFLGVLGEYIGAIHSQVRKRPLVIERERINF
jgi:glycosyltransferase involved in cell wall biosynthesis